MRQLAGRLAAQPVWRHAVVYALLLVALAPLLRYETAFTPDEGLYVAQVRALDDGSWAMDYEARPADPEGAWYPLAKARTADDRFYPYIKHPLYARMLAATASVLGETAGLRLWSILGAVGAALAAALLARELDRRWTVGAFWLAALSPVVVNAHIVWAHSLAAGLAGFATVLALRSAKYGVSGARIVGMAVMVSLLTLVRAEGLLFAATLGVVLVVAGWRRAGVLGSARLAAPATAALVAVAAERAWVNRILGGQRARDVGAELDTAVEVGGGEGRIRGAWHTLFSGGYGEETGALVLLAALTVVVIAVYMARTRSARHPAVPVLFAVAVALVLVRMAVSPLDPATGLFAAWPIALVGLGLLVGGRVPDGARLLGAIAAVFAAAVMLTQYEVGGGLEWGGRYLAPLVPAVAALCAAGLAPLWSSGPRARAAIVSLVVAPAVLGLVVLGSWRARYDAIVDQVAATGADAVVTHEKVLPRYGYQLEPPAGWLLVADEEVDDATRALHAAGIDRVAVVQPFYIGPDDLRGYSEVERRPAPDAERFGWRLWVLSS